MLTLLRAKLNKEFTMRKRIIIAFLTACLAFSWAFLTADEVVIGSGNQMARIPLDFFYHNSLFECLYYQNELGFAQGTISRIAFYNNFVTQLSNKPTKIWLGTTTLTSLTAGWIPSSELTLVFDGEVSYPSGIHIINIELDSLFNYTGDTLVMMVQRPMESGYFSSSDKFYSQTDTITRARNAYHDTQVLDPANPPASGFVLNGQYPKIKITYTAQGIANDLACSAINSDSFVTLGAAETVQVQINNFGYEAQENYTVKLVKEGGELLAMAAGNPIGAEQTIYQTLSWVPSTPGSYLIYADIILPGDQNPANNSSIPQNITALEAGYLNINVGSGNLTGNLPLDFTYHTSLFETIIYAPEIDTTGLITHLIFYNDFIENINGTPVIIWLGETNLVNLPLVWIPSSELSLVYYGTMSFLAGENEIIFPLSPAYNYQGQNLVLMVQRPFDNNVFNTENKFRIQSGAMQRTKYIYSDQQEHDPNAPPLYAFDSNQYPQTGFIMRPPNTGFLRGTVRNGANLVSGATVTADANQIAYTSAAGTYSLLLSSGLHYITASYPGLNSVSREVNIIPGNTTTADFNLEVNAAEDITAPRFSTALKGVFPNPFNPATTVSFSVYRDNTPITIELYNIKGRRVTSLVNAIYSRGEQHFCFSAKEENGKDLASGIYFIQLSAPDYRKTAKVLLLK